jgi:hypothetical protein
LNIINGTGSAVSPPLWKQNVEIISRKKLPSFSRNDVCKFLLKAADQEWIPQKVVLMMGIFDGCRCDYWYVIIFNKQILFHNIEFQLCVSESA